MTAKKLKPTNDMIEENDTQTPNERPSAATCGSAVGAARDVAITMSYDAMRCCLGQKTQHHTLDDVQRWMTAVHDGYYGPSRGDLEAAARNWRDRYSRAESDRRAADEDSERLAAAIRDWMSAQGIQRGTGSPLDDALDSHECRKPDAPQKTITLKDHQDAIAMLLGGEQKTYPCGCVTCICADEGQCHGCGARSCGTQTCCIKRKVAMVPEERLQAVVAALRLAHGWMGDGQGKETNPVSFTSDTMFVEEVLREHDGQNDKLTDSRP